MKFKIERKDFIILCCFCVFLLYICCIGVLNISSLATEGHVSGLNPFPAFTGKYIGATLVLFVLALLGIFAAVNSYIFDRESGFGFSVGEKKNDGYARWAKKSLNIGKILLRISKMIAPPATGARTFRSELYAP